MEESVNHVALEQIVLGVPKQEEKGSELIQKIGNLLKGFLTKFWIWVVAITLFAVAISGQRVTGFRIIYMALFLMFILSFQVSNLKYNYILLLQ